MFSSLLFPKFEVIVGRIRELIIRHGEHCREMTAGCASWHAVTRLAGMRRELGESRKRYDRRGDQFDRPGDRQEC
jgi:hypothetical protein